METLPSADTATSCRDRLLTETRGALRRAGMWRLAGDLLWPVQAVTIGWALALWAEAGSAGEAARSVLPGTLAAAALLALAGLLRAGADRRGAALAFAAAEEAVAGLRNRLAAEALLQSERRQPSAAFAALLVQKLPLLSTYLARYHPAATRARVVPLVMAGLCLPLSWAAALILLIAGPLIPLFMALIGMAAQEASRRQLDEIGTLNGHLADRLAALPDIRLLDAGDRVRDGFRLQADRLRDRSLAVLRIAFLSSTVLELFAALGVAMMAVYVGFSLLGVLDFGAWGRPLGLGEGAVLLLLAPAFFQPLRDLAAAWHDKAAAEAAAAEIDALTAHAPAAILGQGGAAPPLPGPARVAWERLVLDRGDGLAIPDGAAAPGEVLVLSAASGSGKTSLLLALMGILPATSGGIDVAGHTLTGATADAWRARIAWVPQTVRFPDQPLGAFLDPEGGATGAAVAEALTRAAADGVVARLPGGLAARLGESGGGISGGEARRLLLARAILRGADLVLADEPTADLDAATARRVIAALRQLAAEGATVIAASHDPALVAAADRVLRL